MRPFIAILAAGESADAPMLGSLGLSSLDDELPVQRAYHLLSDAIARTNDESLGLKAGARMVAGDTGVFDYLLLTSTTVGQALDVATRYVALLNEALSCGVKLDDEAVAFRFESRLKPPAAVEDFLLSSLFAAQEWLRGMPGLECCFVHPTPSNLEPYRRVFPSARFRFSAACSAFVFPRRQLTTPLTGADPKLHALLREFADITLAQRADLASFTDRVRVVVSRELSTRPLTAALVARRLQTSARTLARKLEAEGTSFYALVDEARRLRALDLMNEDARTLDQIAHATGFSHGESFHRAFRRWTGQTPTEYRLRMP